MIPMGWACREATCACSPNNGDKYTTEHINCTVHLLDTIQPFTWRLVYITNQVETNQVTHCYRFRLTNGRGPVRSPVAAPKICSWWLQFWPKKLVHETLPAFKGKKLWVSCLQIKTFFQCVPPSWYLAADFQMHIIGPILLIGILKNKILGVMSILLCLTSTISSTIAFTSTNKMPAAGVISV